MPPRAANADGAGAGKRRNRKAKERARLRREKAKKLKKSKRKTAHVTPGNNGASAETQTNVHGDIPITSEATSRSSSRRRLALVGVITLREAEHHNEHKTTALGSGVQAKEQVRRIERKLALCMPGDYAKRDTANAR